MQGIKNIEMNEKAEVAVWRGRNYSKGWEDNLKGKKRKTPSLHVHSGENLHPGS